MQDEVNGVAVAPVIQDDANGLSSDDEKDKQSAATATVIPRPKPVNPKELYALPLKSVVKLFVTKVPAKYDYPWQKGHQHKSTGTGFCIKGKLILTNAHVTYQHTVVRVRRPGCTTKFRAKVLCEGREVDLTVLTVEEEEFWEDVPLLEMDQILPELDDNVTVVGYPQGGDGISITRGVISRICLNPYVVGGQSLVTVQIDAAINPGNSGGPVFNSETRKVVGVAQSLIISSQNIGYIISVPIVSLFLNQYERLQKFPSVSSLDITVQALESPSLREHLGLTVDYKGGVRVRIVSPLSCLHGKIEVDDVLLSVFGQDIASDLTVPLCKERQDERLPFFYLITSTPVGTVCPITLLRKGEMIETECVLQPSIHLAPILHQVDCFPRYLIFGGFVFVPLSRPWVQAAYHRKEPNSVITSHLVEFPEFKNQEIVILSKVLSSEVNFGFQGIRHGVVRTFNDIPIKNLAHLAKMYRDCTEKFVSVTLHYKTKLTLNRELCIQSEAETLAQHAIPSSSLGV